MLSVVDGGLNLVGDLLSDAAICVLVADFFPGQLPNVVLDVVLIRSQALFSCLQAIIYRYKEQCGMPPVMRLAGGILSTLAVNRLETGGEGAVCQQDKS